MPSAALYSTCLLVLAALAFAACGQDERAPPSTVSLAADPEVAAATLQLAAEFLAPRALDIVSAPDAEQADLTVRLTGAEPGDALVTRYWVPVVSLDHPAAGLTMADLGEMFAGHVDDWSALTGRPLPLRVLVPNDPVPPIDRWWPDNGRPPEALPLDEVRAALAGEEGVLALLPLDAVDVAMRSLAVAGVNVVFGTGDIATYPLVERIWLTTRQAEDDQFTQLLDQLADAVSRGLGVPAPAPIILRATGDIIPARCAYAVQRDLGDLRHAYLELGPWLAEADLTVGSLDAALSDAGEPLGCVETFSLLAPAASVDGLAFAGFDVMTVATNHVKDCGVAPCGDQAFFETLANLRAAGIEPVGAGADLAAARAPGIVTAGGVRFAFLGYDEIATYYHAEPGVAGTAPLNEAFLREDVAAAALAADVVVVLPQWGVEYTADPTSGQRALAAAAVEAGAGLVIGNHPHWVQANEVIDGVFVAYALGNFVFDQDWSVETQQGVVLEVAFHGTQAKGVRYHPIRIVDQHQPVFADEAEAGDILQRIWDASAALE